MRRRDLGLMLSLAFHLASAPAHAGDADRALVLDRVDRLLAAGVEAGPNLDLRRLRKEIEITGFYREAGARAGARASAYYAFGLRAVYFDPTELAARDAGLASMVLLHEALGANGYPDFQYQTTAALHALARMRSPFPLEIGSPAQHPELLAAEAGGDGVRGGGDATDLAFKLALVDALLELRPSLGERGFRRALVMAIDLRVDAVDGLLADGYRIGLVYENESLRGALGIRPALVWSRASLSAADRAALERFGVLNAEKRELGKRFLEFARP